ncbi:RND family efflux transporter, MFP subunit [Sphingomonas gellani]|uniref:RND family efflux transporter, MFP subunit n=1 Tax=Sphingomonas gellani TaxID=1166340 RepID=A0A1H8CNW4_9SPHN|nr:efflux RND transporter periplasmic adaptor subunit [Sphingomonas gellani]SEM96612.1 RND family efflux transporter, MFP subunit [Sphingomonas gellani]
MNYEARQVTSEEPLALPDPDAERARRRRRLVVIAAVVVALVVAGWFLLGRHKPAGDAAAAGGSAAKQVPNVTVAVPGIQIVDRVIAANGSLAAKRDMPVGVAGEGGLVRAVLVEPGQWVGAGQVLARIDRSVQAETAASLAAQVSVARADLDIAQSELDRARQLVDRGFISKADLQRKGATRDAAAARVKVAQASLAETRARNGRLDIRAPTAGLVLTRQVEAGQIVSSGSGMLFRMAMNGEMEMRAQLAESDLAGLHVGAQAQVTPVGTTRVFPGRVWQVSPVIDPQSRQGVVRIQLRYDPALRPGGFATASIVGGSTSLPLLPESAVQSDRKGNFVYIVDAQNRAQRREVQTGQVTDNGVSITSGLTGQERVVLAAGAFLNPGQEVQPILQATRH